MAPLRRARLLMAVYVVALFALPFLLPDDAPAWATVTVAVVMVGVPVVALVVLGVWWVRVLRGRERDDDGGTSACRRRLRG